MPPCNPTNIIITFYPHRIDCCWLKHSNNKKPYHLKAYHTEKLENLELEQLIIFNPSHIGSVIKQFLKFNNIKNPFTFFCLNGPTIVEQFVPAESATPDPDQFPLVHKNNLIWDYTYLYSTDNGQFMFYVSGIKREQLFQYQLLAINNQLNLISVTSDTMALINLYEHTKGSQFRHSQLGIDLLENNHQVNHIISESILDELVSIDPSVCVDIKTEAPSLLSALGLFITRNKTNE